MSRVEREPCAVCIGGWWGHTMSIIKKQPAPLCAKHFKEYAGNPPSPRGRG